MEGPDSVLVPCVGGSHDGRLWPMHPLALVDGSQVIVPSHGVFVAMTEASEEDPVSGPAENAWERYVVRAEGTSWLLRFDGRLDHLPVPWQPH